MSRGMVTAAITVSLLGGLCAVATTVLGDSGPPRPDAEAGRAQTPPRVPRKAAATALPVSPPVRLRIPRIGVDAPVDQLGLDEDGELEVPPISEAMRVGWYKYGPMPGQNGPAVLAGHVDTKHGPAVLYRLGELKRGDRVTVVRQDRSVAKFVIDAVEEADKDDFPTRKVYGRVPYPALRIITCGGAFNWLTRHYEGNVIAYGHLVRR